MIRITFDRIGRKHEVPPLDLDYDLTEQEAISNAVLQYARPRLMSSDVWVEINPEEKTVLIGAGFHNAGTGRIEVLEEVAA